MATWSCIYCYLIADILTKLLQKCSLSGPQPNILFFFFPSLNLIGYHGNKKSKFATKYSKIKSSEAVWGIKLKFSSIVSNIKLYKDIVFYCRCSCTLVATVISIDLQWEIWKIRFIAIFIAVILTNVLQKCLLSLFSSIVANIKLYKDIVFYCRCSCTLVAMVISIDLQWEIWKIRFIAIFITVILTNVLQKCLLNGPPPGISF